MEHECLPHKLPELPFTALPFTGRAFRVPTLGIYQPPIKTMNIYDRAKDKEASQKALTRNLPDAHTEAENDLIEHYGISGRQAYESASSLILCLFAGAVLLASAVVLELITK